MERKYKFYDKFPEETFEINEEIIAQRIKERRTSFNMSMDDVAKILGYPSGKAVIYSLEHNKTRIRIEHINLFSKIYNTNVPYLLGYIDDPSPLISVKQLMNEKEKAVNNINDRIKNLSLKNLNQLLSYINYLEFIQFDNDKDSAIQENNI